jgi:hypothetical protein
VPVSERLEEPLIAAVLFAEGGHPLADPTNLRCPIQSQQSAQIDRVKACQPLGSGFADQAGEHQGQHQRPHPIERRFHRFEHGVHRVQQPGGRQRRQDHQRTGQRQARALTNHRCRSGQRATAGRLAFGLTALRAGQRHPTPAPDPDSGSGSGSGSGVCLEAQSPTDRVSRNTVTVSDIPQRCPRLRAWKRSTRPCHRSASTGPSGPSVR